MGIKIKKYRDKIKKVKVGFSSFSKINERVKKTFRWFWPCVGIYITCKMGAQDKVLIFLYIWIVIFVYLKMYKVTAFFMSQIKIKNFIINNKNFCRKLNIILIKINNWKNPLIVILSQIDKLLFIMYKNINYILKKNKININSAILEFIYIILNIIFIGVIKAIFHTYYTMLIKWKNSGSMYNIFIKKKYLLVICFLVFTDLISDVLCYINLKNILILYFIIL